MKTLSKILMFVLFTVSLWCFIPSAMASDQLGISADAAILIDMKTGQILYSKNPFKRRPPASTTKILTALLAIENGNLNGKVNVSRKAAHTEGSSMYLTEGEILPLRDLLYGALMHSGNDACEAMAEYIGGSRDKFALLMNIKALSLGTINSNFTNPHGLPDESHYTCAYDLALITRHALKNPDFSKMVDTRNKSIEWPGQKWNRRLQNTNQLLWRYLWADGVKTGTTSAAGQCLVSSASKGSRQLIAVVLSSGDRWQDSIKMFEYGFNQFEYTQVAVAGIEYTELSVQNGVRKNVPVVYASDLGILTPRVNPKALVKKVLIDQLITAPVIKSQVVGSVNYYVDDIFVEKTNLITAYAVERQGSWGRFKEWLTIKINNIF